MTFGNLTDDIQKNVIENFTQIPQSKYCFCSICLGQYVIIEHGREFMRKNSSIFKLDSVKYRQFYKLIAPVKGQKIMLKIQIPTLCFFENGQAKYIFRCQAGYINQVILNCDQPKNIANYFTDSRRARSTFKIDPKQQNHIRHFNTVVPSLRLGVTKENKDNKPVNYVFHCSKDVADQGELLKINQSSVAQIAVVKLKDSGFEMMNEKQLRGLLKVTSKFDRIDFIQAYIKPHSKNSQMITNQYNGYLKPTNTKMFQRSLLHMKISANLINSFSNEYASIQSLEQYQNILREIPQDFCQYQAFKIVHYLQLHRQMKVLNLQTVWFRDQFNQICFFGILQFLYEQKQSYITNYQDYNEIHSLKLNSLTELEQHLLQVWEKKKYETTKMYIYEESTKQIQQRQLIQEIKLKRKKKCLK